MDAVKFIEERNRMCRYFDNGCDGCPASNACKDELCCAVGQESTMDAKAQIAMVEKWASAHPRRTRQDVFLEQYPEATVADDGILTLCPSTISSTHRSQYGGCGMRGTPCSDCCREFWNHEIDLDRFGHSVS